MMRSRTEIVSHLRSIKKRRQDGFSMIELSLVFAVVGSGLVVTLLVQQYNALRQQAQSVGHVLVELNGGVGAYLTEHYKALMALPDRCSQVNFVHRSGNTSTPSVAISGFSDCALNLQHSDKGSAKSFRVVNGRQPSASELRSLGYWPDSVLDSLPWPVSPVMVGTTDGSVNTKVIPAQFGVRIDAACVDDACSSKALSSLLYNTQPFDTKRLFNNYLNDTFVSMASSVAGDDALISVGAGVHDGELVDRQGKMVARNPLRAADTSKGIASVLAMRNGHGSKDKDQFARRDAALGVMATGNWNFNEKSLDNLKDLNVQGNLHSAALNTTSASFTGAKVLGSQLTVQDASGHTVISLTPGGGVAATSARITGEVTSPNARISGDVKADRAQVTGTLTAAKAKFTDKLHIQVSKTRNTSCDPTVETLARDSSPDYSAGEGMLICTPSKQWVVWRGPKGETGPQGPKGS